ncbi:ATP-binding protein [Olivibacter jilunii]|uniref:ATP-binding protein n=1 Tax=Olivibacter jilunii TaxID=985016 RepID=UPI003F1620B6
MEDKEKTEHGTYGKSEDRSRQGHSSVRRGNATSSSLSTQRRFKLSDETYYNLFNSIDEGFCIIEVIFDRQERPVDYRFIEVNEPFEQLTGIVDAEGRRMRDIAPLHESLWFEVYGRIALTGKPERFQMVASQLDRIYDVYAFRVGEPAENQVAILFKDITSQRREDLDLAELAGMGEQLSRADSAEAALAIFCQRLGNYLDLSFCALVEIDPLGQHATVVYEWHKKGFHSIRGVYSIADYISLGWEQAMRAGKNFIVEDLKGSAHPGFERYAMRGIASFISIPLIRNGRWLCMVNLYDSKPRKWLDTEIKLGNELANRFWNRYERLQAEEALRKSEESYRAIVNQSIVGILRLNFRGEVVFTNDQFCKMLGYSPSEMMKLTVRDLMYPEDLERNNLLFSRMVAEGTPYDIEKRLICKNGSLIWVNNHVSPIFNSDGKPESAVVVSVDVTRQKAVEKMKDDFIGVASHELKTPLTSIKAYTQLLKKSTTDDTPASFINKLSKQVDRLTSLVNMLLDTSKISGGHLILHLAEVNLNELIDDCIQDLQPISIDHKLIFHKEKIPHLIADKNRINQVLTNLISNAVKYSPEGGAVHIKATDMGYAVKVSVQDYGVGIAAEDQSKIFNRFFRVTSKGNDNISGIGLGLYIVSEIVKKHNGILGVESVPGQGATFFFEIPYQN